MPIAASAQVIPANEHTQGRGLKDESSLTRIPTVDEVPVPAPARDRGEVVVYSGVSFGSRAQARRGYSRSTTSAPAESAGPRGPIESLQLFTDEQRPGQIFARVLIIEEGQAVPREALITPMIAVSKQDREELDAEYSLRDLVEQANVELSRYFEGFGPIDSEVKLREFNKFIKKQSSLGFLFSNLTHRNRGMGFDLFSAYFAPGGALSGVGVFVNTWL